MKVINVLALLVVVIGALNWSLVGLFNFDLVKAVFGEMTTVTRGIYLVLGPAGLYMLTFFNILAEKPKR